MDKLGRYQIREMIGEGAMASVYQAYDPEIDRTLAIKVLKPHLARVEQYRARFLREARAAGVLSHPNIVTIFDVGVEGDVPYIAMELLDGMTLGDLIRSGREFTVDEVVAIGIEPGVSAPMSAWWARSATNAIGFAPAPSSRNTGATAVTSGRWVPPR